MKKENVQNTSEKRSVNDFEHRMTIQLTEQHYIDYAMAHSQDQIKKGPPAGHPVGGAVHRCGLCSHLPRRLYGGMDVGNLPGGRRADDRLSAL